MSLLSRIRAAKSVDEVNTLLVEGEGYKFASASTRNRWRKAAEAAKKRIG